ncbi:MAG: glycosyltransferase family 4 protein [Terriglobales bacterium]
MKILYVSQYFPPEMGAPSARVGELSRHWVREGHEVTVLTGFPNHPTGKIAASYRKKIRGLVMKENADGVRVIRTWLLPLPNQKSVERILNHLSFCISAAITGLFLPRADVVIATSPQLLVGISGWWLASLKRVPFVFEVRDLWPESLVAVGMGDRSSLLYRVLASIAKFLYRKADRIVVVTPAFKDYLMEQMHIGAGKIVVVQNGVETSLFDPVRADRNLKKDLGLEERFVVSYIGTMGLAHGLGKILDTAAQLQQAHAEIIFLFVGEGSDKEHIISAATSRKLSNVRFVDEQPRETIPDYICASDVCLVLLKKSDIFKTVIPTKMLEFMACARPVILGVEGQARKIVDESQAGVFIRPESADDLSEAVVRLFNDPHLRLELGRNGRKYILQHLSRPQTARIYIEFLRSILEGESITESVAA